MDQPVSVQSAGGIIVLTLDVPPRNTLRAGVRAAIAAAIAEAESTPGCRAIVLAGRGKVWASGPDPDDVADTTVTPTLVEIAALVEACRLPVIAALHGAVLGAAFELALAAHYRIADRRVRLGSPHVRIGLTPAAGATQRLPRLVGVESAIELLCSGRSIDAEGAAKIGLVDAVADGPLPAFVLGWVRSRLADGLTPRRISASNGLLRPARPHLKAIERIRPAIAEDPNPARGAILDLVEASLLLPFDAGMTMERAAHDDSFVSSASRALRHMIHAEARAALPPVEAPVSPRRLARLGVVGAGRIGRGVVAACLDAGYPVTLVEKDIDRLEEAVESIIDIYDQDVTKGGIDAVARDRRIGQLTGTTDVGALAGSDFVIEATPDDATGKRRVFSALDAVMKRDAILASTTTGLDLDGLAAGTGRADHVIGLHFFPPAYRMRAVEVVVGLEATDETVATAFDLAKRLGKIPVASAVGEGYIAYRMAAAMIDAGAVLMMQGRTADEIDAAMIAYGCPLGPMKLADAIGIDLLLSVQPGGTSPTRERIRVLLTGMIEGGRRGRQSGRGFYRYGKGGEAAPDPDTEALARSLTSPSPALSKEDIRRRILAALANEGARLLQDGVAQRPSDIDVLMVHVFAFPRIQGGPMMAADLTGILRMARDLESFADEAPDLWKPVSLWSELLSADEEFSSLNGAIGAPE